MHCTCISWHSTARYREYDWRYGPHLKPLALVDDRRMDYDRSRPLSIHEPRVPLDGASGTIRRGRSAGAPPAMAARRAHPDAAGVVPLPRMARRKGGGRDQRGLFGHPARLPRSDRGDCRPRGPRGSPFRTWRSIVNRRGTSATSSRWFEQHTPEFFEPLEIWHIPVLREAFERRVGRRPRARPFVPAVVAGCAPATSGGASPQRRGGGCACEMARPFLTVLTAPIPTTPAPRCTRGSGAGSARS